MASKKAFLKSVGLAVAALISSTAIASNGLAKQVKADLPNLSGISTKNDKSFSEPLTIQPAGQKQTNVARHYSHYSHYSHASHSSHSSHYSSGW